MTRVAVRQNIPLLTALTLLVEIPVVILVCSRGALHVVAAYHVMDVSPDKVGWLTFFLWAAFALPLAWIACFVLAIIELMKRNRLRWLTAYVGAPAAATLAYWLAWETFTNFLP